MSLLGVGVCCMRESARALSRCNRGGEEDGQVTVAQVAEVLVGHAEESAWYSSRIGKPLGGFEWRNLYFVSLQGPSG